MKFLFCSAFAIPNFSVEFVISGLARCTKCQEQATAVTVKREKWHTRCLLMLASTWRSCRRLCGRALEPARALARELGSAQPAAAWGRRGPTVSPRVCVSLRCGGTEGCVGRASPQGHEEPGTNSAAVSELLAQGPLPRDPTPPPQLLILAAGAEAWALCSSAPTPGRRPCWASASRGLLRFIVTKPRTRDS